MVVNGCPLLAVQAHVPPENLVVSNSNQVVTMLRVTDTVQAHVMALGAGAQLTYRVGAALFQVSSLVSWYVSLNIFPFALNECAGQSLHFSNSLALFFSCSNADATTSALGMSRFAATEKHVDSERGERTRTNLESTRKCVLPAVRW